MQFGFSIMQGTDGKHYGTLTIQEGMVQTQVVFTDQDNFDVDIPHMIEGLQEVSGQLKQARSGIVIAKEVPNGSYVSGTAQGGQQRRTRR